MSIIVCQNSDIRITFFEVYKWPPSIVLTEVDGVAVSLETSAANAVDVTLTSIHSVNRILINFFI